MSFDGFVDAMFDLPSRIKSLFRWKSRIRGGDMSALIYPAVTIPNAHYIAQRRMSFGVFSPPKHEGLECRDYTHHKIWQNVIVRKTGQLSIAFKYGDQINFLDTTPRPAGNKEARENVARFMDYVEREKLGWADRSKVHLTQYPDIISVKLAPGWLMNTASCSLATIMLRLGFYCRSGTEFNWLLDQYLFSRETKPAIHRFLSGYYHYTGPDGDQWYSRFDKVNSVLASRLLVRRENVEHFAKAHWESLGCPKGRDDECWFHGCTQVKSMVDTTTPLPFP